MDTNAYYTRLLDEVLAAGESPELAYQARTRLRRALLALERGRNYSDAAAPVASVPAMALITRRLKARVLHLCQPSEALDARWRREWRSVSTDVQRLKDLVAAG